MFSTALRAQVVAALGLVVLAGVLLAGGVFVRSIVASSLRAAEEVRVARTVARDLLTGQLDEETGVRGFAVTRDASFLQPFDSARLRLPGTFDRLDGMLRDMDAPGARASLARARETNAQWLASVAIPVMAHRATPRHGVQRRGKDLVDQFRADLISIDGILARRERGIEDEAQQAIDRILWLVLAALGVIVVLFLLFATLQRRLSERVEAARRRAEAEERRSAELTAAYEAEKRIADTLQDALAQTPLPTVEALRFSAVYVPAAEAAKVGGDWYDIVDLGANRVLFVIGDVAGHGIDAAVTMSRARQALISAALIDSNPASVLARANEHLLRQRSPFVTAVTGYADGSSYEFFYASAGHPPPVLFEPGRAPRFLECGSLPLGMFDTVAYTAKRVQSVPGAMLVLYTDGAVEHSRDVLEGEALLLQAVARVKDITEANAATVIRDAIFADRSVADDVAILTIGFDDEPAGRVAVSADSAHSSGERSPTISLSGHNVAGRRAS